MSDNFLDRIDKAIASKMEADEIEAEKLAEQDAIRKSEYERFRTCVDETITPAIKNFMSALEDRGFAAELIDDERSAISPEININNITFRMADDPDNLRFGFAFEAKFQRKPGDDFITFSARSNAGRDDDLNIEDRYHISKIQEDLVINFLTHCFEKAVPNL